MKSCATPRELTDRFHFLRLPQRLLGLPPLVTSTASGTIATTVPFSSRTGRIWKSNHRHSPTGQVHVNLLLNDFAVRDSRHRGAHGLGHARSGLEPRRVPEWLPDNVVTRCRNAGKRSGVRVEQRTVECH